MGFEACHPAVNFIFFAAAIYGAVSFKHPVFLAIAYVCAFVYSIKRCGKRAVIFSLCLLPLILAFALYYSSYLAGSARGCRFSSRSCCGSFPELAGRRGKSTSPKRALAGAAIKEMSSSGSSTACGYFPC